MSGAVDVVVDAERFVWRGCVPTVVDVADDFGWWVGEFEWSPVTIRTTTSTATAAIAAAGPPRRRGRWLMDSMSGSSVPLMKVAGTGSGPASSKVTGLEGLGTGGGGRGGTTGLPGSVRRTVDDPAIRNALAGKGASPLLFSPLPAEGWARISSSV